MSDILPTLILIGLVYALYRWLTGPKPPSDPFRNVKREMVEAVTSAFPDVPLEAVVYSLSRTRSAQTTSELILERGTLPPPPPGFSVPDSLRPVPVAGPSSASSSAATAVVTKPHQTLIDRYNLGSRVSGTASAGAGTGASTPAASDSDSVASAPAAVGGRWEATREDREKELRARKERMVLEARRRVLEKQAQKTAAAAAAAAAAKEE